MLCCGYSAGYVTPPTQIVGKEDVSKVVRLQFARMKPGTQIKPHQDMGGYAKVGTRA